PTAFYTLSLHDALPIWLRIGTKPEVMQALEDGRIDIARAQYLAPVQDEEELSSLIEQAPTLSMTEFAQLAKSVVINNSAYSIDEDRKSTRLNSSHGSIS